MTSEQPPAERETIAVSEADIDEAIEACDGDLRATIKALLVGQQYLEIALEMSRQEASWGYVRGRPSRRLRALEG
ncbi:hypothetical protein FHS55_002615 [Angulomicrobium tetraedrale]|uniref:Uncharacterized protein n=1 Tax=Ancylobacter tetraedralis TaxID=217068 RepID=A0A839ZBC4_9HYPH|nr:hypothetical protein [Ancylobacter tetraedralis]MBB3772006.1 hypothetical protein [Ancylobacter tetraedralis]